MQFLVELKDDSYPFQVVSKEKYAARAIVLNKYRNIALLHLSGEFQGESFNFHTTPGGGIETGETPDFAIKREILEEIGYESNILHEIGIIIDYYIDQPRKTISYYFIVEVTKKKHTCWAEDEKKIIKNIKWINIESALQLLESTPLGSIGRIIQRRDVYALKEAMKIMILN